MNISPSLFITLLIASLWATLFSMAVTAGIRGYRNLGILACYVSPLIFLFTAGWRAVALTWIAFGIAGGVIYTIWELIQRLKTSGPEKPKVSLGHVFPALLAWPIMIPEAVEYSLATLGILKSKPDPTPAP